VNAQFDQAHDKATELAWVSSRFGFIFKLAYIYSARAWLLAFVMLPFVSRTGVASAAAVSADVAAVRTTWQLVIEMLVANGRLLTLHAMSQHMIGLCKRVCDLMDGLAILDKVYTLFIYCMFKKQQQPTLFLWQHTVANAPTDSDRIAFDHVDVYTPAGHLLVRDLSFDLRSGGDSLLLTGHNGAGKSSIFRCLGGLWPAKGGAVRKPLDVFYLPQKPFNVVGSLADELAYPQSGSVLDRHDLARLCAMVDLNDVLAAHDPAAGFCRDIFLYVFNLFIVNFAVVDWQECLSLGQQQRVSIARLLFHNPQFAVLDECLSQAGCLSISYG
jgi:ATP-binding cassette subfamily D (ALD) protein 3